MSSKETLVAWMIKWGYATGHGDTTENLLEELREQIAEGKAEQRQRCAGAAQQCILNDPDLSPLVSSVTHACLNATGESDE